MAKLSVAEAASRLGVGVPRIHQRIADGSLRAERIGSQWVVDELSLLQIAERRDAGRPLSQRSAWALIWLSSGDEEAGRVMSAVERSRARQRLHRLLDQAECGSGSEETKALAVSLRSLFRNRAERRLLRAASADLKDLRGDARWRSLVSSAASGIGTSDVEGYVGEVSATSLVRDYLLVPSVEEANVVMHVVPEDRRVPEESKLLLAADLADHRGPREEARAAELLRELAVARRCEVGS